MVRFDFNGSMKYKLFDRKTEMKMETAITNETFIVFLNSLRPVELSGVYWCLIAPIRDGFEFRFSNDSKWFARISPHEVRYER